MGVNMISTPPFCGEFVGESSGMLSTSLFSSVEDIIITGFFFFTLGTVLVRSRLLDRLLRDFSVSVNFLGVDFSFFQIR